MSNQLPDISLAALTERNDRSALEKLGQDNAELQTALKDLLVAIDRIEPC